MSRIPIDDEQPQEQDDQVLEGDPSASADSNEREKL